MWTYSPAICEVCGEVIEGTFAVNIPGTVELDYPVFAIHVCCRFANPCPSCGLSRIIQDSEWDCGELCVPCARCEYAQCDHEACHIKRHGGPCPPACAGHGRFDGNPFDMGELIAHTWQEKVAAVRMGLPEKSEPLPGSTDATLAAHFTAFSTHWVDQDAL